MYEQRTQCLTNPTSNYETSPRYTFVNVNSAFVGFYATNVIELRTFAQSTCMSGLGISWHESDEKYTAPLECHQSIIILSDIFDFI